MKTLIKVLKHVFVLFQTSVHKRVPGQHLRVPSGASVSQPKLGPPTHHREFQVAAGQTGETALTWQRFLPGNIT